MPWINVVSLSGGDIEYKHASRKIAERQFNNLKNRQEVNYICLIHQTKRLDDVVLSWERE